METAQLDIRVESVTDNLDAIGDLLELHWEESAKNKGLMVLNPDKERYKAIDKTGKLLGIYAYVGSELAGYSVNFVDNHLHYKDLIVCSNDVLFLDPAYRATPLGLRLMRKTEQFAKQRGARLMLWHAKENSPLDLILQRMKFNVQDIIYSREL